MSGLLTFEERARLARLALRPRRRLPSDAPGGWRTGRIGHGVLFADHRPYALGDDPRYVDWHVAARLGDLVVKRFESEEDLDLVLCVDRSLSMQGPKALMARRLAAALGHLALDHLDRVRLSWWPALPRARSAPQRGPGALVALLEALERTPEEGAARAGDATAELLDGRRRALVAVISDFHSGADVGQEPLAALRRLSARGHEVLALHVLDAQDVELPPGAAVRAVDAESGLTLDLDVTPELQQTLRTGWRRRTEAFARACTSAGIAHVRVEAGGTLWDALRGLLSTGRIGRA